jgi:histidine ammonia-lyase
MHTSQASPSLESLTIGLRPLTIEEVVTVARERVLVRPLPANSEEGNEQAPMLRRMRASAEWVAAMVDRIAKGNGPPPAIYGINTGFGANAGKAAFTDPFDALQLSRNLVLSHAAGTGDFLDEEVVRATMLIRVNSLAQGYSGVRVELVNTLIAMLNAGVYPAIPEQGSLGASGDLAPLAHLALLISRPPDPSEPDDPAHSGQAFVDGKLVSGLEAMGAAGVERLVLGPKEALALVNGATFSTAIAVLALYDAERLVETSEVALAMSVDALRGYRDAFLPHLHALRGMPGQQTTAARVYAVLRGSTLARGDADRDLAPEDTPPQDPYSLRCAPQVIGAVRDTLAHVRDVLTREINAVTDNPLIFTDEDGDLGLPRVIKAVSGGNFHGQPVAFVSDFLSIAVTSLANIAERRVYLLVDPTHNRGLPAFLSHRSHDAEGIETGLMMAQYTAAALVSENKTLAHPDSVDSITTSANQEDYVSMSMNAARHARRVVRNAEGVVATELLTAAQALHLREHHLGDGHPGVGVRAARKVVRTCAPVLEADEPLHPYIECLRGLIRSGEIIRAVADVVGEVERTNSG